MHLKIPFLFLLLFLPRIGWGSPLAHPFYEEKARGWFWKEAPPEAKAPPVKPTPQPEASKAPDPLKLEDIPLTSAWFRSHLGAIRDEALDDPSPEKVRRFFMLQKALLDKADRFAQSAQSVVLQDPELDERGHHATTPSALALTHHAENASRHGVLREMGKKAGLLFVFRSDCRFCHLMAPLVRSLCEEIAMRLYPVSLDGGNLEGLEGHPLIKDPSLTLKLHLAATPALFLMVPEKGVYPVLEGSAPLPDLEAHLEAAGRIAGLVPKLSPD